MNIELRPEVETDRGFLCRLYASTRAPEMDLVPWTAEEKERFLRSQFEAQHAYYRENYPDAEYRIVVVDGERAGRLYVDHWPEEIRLVDVSLLPEHRNRGIGTRLLEGLFAEADRSGLPLTIHVEMFNPARRLYERLGFQPVADRGVYVLMERAPRASRLPTTARPPAR